MKVVLGVTSNMKKRITQIALLWMVSVLSLSALPSGESVVSGSATFNRAGSVLTVQNSNGTIIEWQGFSIAAGELTKFIQQSSSSSVLNRDIGGNISAIYGMLQSNGNVYLINTQGILIGATGVIDTNSFVASTLDLSNQEFITGGEMNFVGDSSASIVNLGTINGADGNVYLIAQEIDNGGTIYAPNGTAGAYAGSEVYLAADGEISVRIGTQNDVSTITAIQNTGLIEAAQAKLCVVNGNLYALAINNEGTVRATGTAVQNGTIYFTTDAGEISNTGTVDAPNGDLNISAGTTTTGTGTLTSSGTTQIDAGSILISNSDALGSGSTSSTDSASVIFEAGEYNNISEIYVIDITNSGDINIDSGITATVDSSLSGTSGITKTGLGTLALSSTGNSFTGNVTINGGTVQLGASDVIPDTNNLVMSGGTLDLNGNTETVSELTLNASSTIDFGSGGGLLFTDSLTLGSNTLTITGWSGTQGATGSSGQLFFSDSTLSSYQLANIYFDGYGYGATQLVSGEVVPILQETQVPIYSSPSTVGGNSPGVYGNVHNSGNVYQAQNIPQQTGYNNNLYRTINAATYLASSQYTSQDREAFGRQLDYVGNRTYAPKASFTQDIHSSVNYISTDAKVYRGSGELPLR